MCGIVGYISRKEYKEDVLVQMRDMLKHRGPDDCGLYMDWLCDHQVALAHRRLSIRDLSKNGAQPMLSDDKSVVVIYNGEIYNSDQIKEELIKKNHIFKSTCDTEVLLEAYLEWGINSVKKFNGMFAYAILDKREGTLYLVRDRMGEKPLYYSITEQGIVFGSEIVALEKYPQYNKQIDKEALAAYLWQMYIPAPKTIYMHTCKLEPGYILKYDIRSETLIKEQYWAIDTFYMDYSQEIETNYIDLIENMLKDSIKARMVSDVPLGVFLSGGIDSTLITALSTKVTNQKIKTFSIGFNEQDYNEAIFAKRISEHLGTEHNELYCSAEEAKKYVLDLPKVYSEPMADNSQLAMLLLSKFTREKVTVALSGDGGDELFYGYPSYKNVYRNKRLQYVGELLRPMAAILSLLVPYNDATWKVNKITACTNENGWFEQDLYASAYIRESLFADKIQTYYYIDNQLQSKGNLDERILNLGIKDTLQEDLLTKVDRATMAYSLEVRTPFLDHRLVELSQKIPPELKAYQGQFKYPLKKILYKYVPRELVDRPKKGFGVPINKWLHEDFCNLIEDYFMPDYINRQGIFSGNRVNALYRAFLNKPTPAVDRIVWCLLVFQMWWEESQK